MYAVYFLHIAKKSRKKQMVHRVRSQYCVKLSNNVNDAHTYCMYTFYRLSYYCEVHVVLSLSLFLSHSLPSLSSHFIYVYCKFVSTARIFPNFACPSNYLKGFATNCCNNLCACQAPIMRLKSDPSFLNLLV